MLRPLTVPYCTVKGFRRALSVITKAESVPIVDRAFLVDHGLSPHAAYPVLGALRYLSLIDELGAPTEAMAAFLDDDALAGRRVIVESAYRAILAELKLPVRDREELDVLLVERHSCAQGVAAFCSTFLLWLLAESGLPVADPGRHRRGRPPAHLSQISAAARKALGRHGGTSEPAATPLVGRPTVRPEDAGEPLPVRRPVPTRRALPDLV